MDYTRLLLLLLLSLSGAVCAVVQWTELDEATVRFLLFKHTLTIRFFSQQ